MEILIWIDGVTPLLQNRATEEALMGKTRSNNPVEPEDPRTVAERNVYRLENNQIAIPGAAFGRLIREAGSAHKVKGRRKSLKYLVPAAVIILDDLCGLYQRDRKTPIEPSQVDRPTVPIPSTTGPHASPGPAQ